MSNKSERELMIEAHTEVDATIDRMKSRRAQMTRMMAEMTEDIDSMVALIVEIEALPGWGKENEAESEVDEIEAFKLTRPEPFDIKAEIERIVMSHAALTKAGAV